MADDKEEVFDMGEIGEELMAEPLKVIVVRSEEELMSFLIDILSLEDDEDSSDVMGNPSYSILFSLLGIMKEITVVIEEKHVDRIYRDSYYMHFSCKHAEYGRFCRRLFVFEGDLFGQRPEQMLEEFDAEDLQECFVGTIVIRPLRSGKIGRSLINPYFLLKDHEAYLRYAEYSVTLLGMRLYINAFPFSMQDGETTTCAEITILNMMDYFSRRYSEYKSILPNEIAKIVGESEFERTLPARGLNYPTITKVFSEVGFYPRLYKKNVFADMSQFKRVMHYYVESGLPVALGVKVDEQNKHSVICIGHGKVDKTKIGKKLYAVYGTSRYIWLINSADLCNNYIIMDDGHVPYENCEWKVEMSHNPQKADKNTLGKYEPEMLVVPLYKRMFLEAQDAYDICTSALADDKVGIRNFYPEIGTKENPVIIRLFMCSSRNYKRKRIKSFGEQNKEVKERYSRLRLPRFVWVCEIYDERSYCLGKVKGEIVVDATSAPYNGTKSVLLFHYPCYILPCRKNVEDAEASVGQNEEFEIVKNWEEFDRYDHNLISLKKLRDKIFRRTAGKMQIED